MGRDGSRHYSEAGEGDKKKKRGQGAPRGPRAPLPPASAFLQALPRKQSTTPATTIGSIYRGGFHHFTDSALKPIRPLVVLRLLTSVFPSLSLSIFQHFEQPVPHMSIGNRSLFPLKEEPNNNCLAVTNAFSRTENTCIHKEKAAENANQTQHTSERLKRRTGHV